MTVKNFRELYHDAVEQRDELFSLFNIGLISLEQRAYGETLFWRIAQKAVRHAKTQKYVADEFQDLEEVLHEKFVCNFSVFQSIPDHWALDQLFPVLPIHRLFERPTRRGTLVDITCDSDGEIDKFVDLKDIKKALELHPFQPGQPYYLAVMLIGAYQDVMGDLHNLFGSVNEAHLIVGENGRVHTQVVRRGNVVRETLGVFGYEPSILIKQIEALTEARLKEGAIKEKEAKAIVQEYRAAFDAYTYLT
jgi:arginine decarboxylase